VNETQSLGSRKRTHLATIPPIYISRSSRQIQRRYGNTWQHSRPLFGLFRPLRSYCSHSSNCPKLSITMLVKYIITRLIPRRSRVRSRCIVCPDQFRLILLACVLRLTKRKPTVSPHSLNRPHFLNSFLEPRQYCQRGLYELTR
jgi:hypothetical protein